MVATVTGLDGALAGKPFTVGSRPITFGRGDENDVVISNLLASRVHAELRPEAGGYVLQDRGSSNGTWVNGSRVSAQQLHPGDEIVIGGETFRFETSDVQTSLQVPRVGGPVAPAASAPVLRVTVTGGGPVA